ncbi:MAG: hypothetical protein H7321_00595 [Bacteroidia bacterium]|nr:hypothetical protein [Bacteroidia bacterium]
MKKYILILLFITANSLSAQNIYTGISTNLVMPLYQSYGIDATVVDPESRFQFMFGFYFTTGKFNGNQNKSIPKYDSRYMEKKSDKITGPGFDLQVRYELYSKESEKSERKWLASLGFLRQNLECDYYKNDYVLNPADNLYHYELQEYVSPVKRNLLHLQLVRQVSGRLLFGEFGFGLAYSAPLQEDDFKRSRNYGKSAFDFTYSGIAPCFSLRIGAWINK